MTDHPISMPSPELAAKWVHEIYGNTVVIPLQKPTLQVIEHAVRWGADQELEACCEWFVRDWTDIETADKLRAARRPKPPSLKEQALEALERFSVHAHAYADEMMADFDLLSRALEQLDD
jgi:hypothetical protein